MNVEDPVVTETFSNIPVQIVNDEVVTSKGYQYSIESGESIDVRVRGKRSIVDNIKDTDLVAVADFNSMSNMYLITIETSCPQYSENELIVTARTETMAIKLEESDTQSFNIRIVRQGEVREGYFIYNTILSTALMQVEAAVSQLAKIKEIVVEVDVEGRRESFSTIATPIAYDLEGNVIDAMKVNFSQATVNVDVGIHPTKEIEVDVKVIGEPAQGYYVEETNFAPSTIMIAGSQEDLDKLDKIVLECDITGATENVDLQYDLDTYLYEKYEVRYVSAASENVVIGVAATIKKMEEKKIRVSLSDIEQRSLEEGLECTLYSSPEIEIRVLGRPELLEDVTPEDLMLYVDLSSCTVGTYSRTINSEYEGELIVEPYSAMFLIRRND